MADSVMSPMKPMRKSPSEPNRWVLAVAAMVLACVFGLSAAHADDLLVYNADLDVEVEADDDAGLRQAEPNRSQTGEAPADDPPMPTYESGPEASDRVISDIRGESDDFPMSPFPPGMFQARNVYSETNANGTTTAVFAGVATETGQPYLVALDEVWETGEQTAEEFPLPQTWGSVWLSTFEGRLLYFRTSSGNAGSLWLDPPREVFYMLASECGAKCPAESLSRFPP